MGHDHHFLSRLDRVHAQHTELALSLYRDDELIRRILKVAEVPEAAERIAISLDDDRRGPFIIVARDGHFVTCLGEGMTPGTTHVISRARLDDISKYISVLRERMEQARAMVGDRTGSLITSILLGGDGMSREAFRGILSVSEMFRVSLLRWVYEETEEIPKLVPFALARFDPSMTGGLRAYWYQTWYQAHLQLVCGGEWQPGLRDPLKTARVGLDQRLNLSRCGVQLGWMPATLRAIRTLSLAGSDGLPILEYAWQESDDLTSVLHAMFGILGIAARDRRSAPSAADILAHPPGLASRSSAVAARYKEWVPSIRASMQPGDPWRSVLPRARDSVVTRCVHLPYPMRAAYEFPDKVPDRLAMAVLANTAVPSLDCARGTQTVIKLASWAATAEPEDFYPDAAFQQLQDTGWTPAKTRKLGECMSAAPKQPRADLECSEAHNQKPNEPCACGSGKKFKRCCGSVVAS